MEFKFSRIRRCMTNVKLKDDELPITKNFKDLRSFLQTDRGVNKMYYIG